MTRAYPLFFRGEANVEITLFVLIVLWSGLIGTAFFLSVITTADGTEDQKQLLWLTKVAFICGTVIPAIAISIVWQLHGLISLIHKGIAYSSTNIVVSAILAAITIVIANYNDTDQTGNN